MKLIIIRPRRFGKSSLIALLTAYYDRGHADRFDLFFGGTDIGQNPTSEHNQYCVLTFNFSRIDAHLDRLEATFSEQLHNQLKEFLSRYPQEFPPEVATHIWEASNAVSQVDRLFSEAKQRNVKIYVLVDEYDNFANTLLAQLGTHAYTELTHGDGFLPNRSKPKPVSATIWAGKR